MAAQELEMEVARHGRPVEGGRFTVSGDLDDYGLLRDALRSWLTGRGWSEGLWDQFEGRVRIAGTLKFRKTVRAA